MGLPSGGHPLFHPYLSLVFLQEAQRQGWLAVADLRRVTPVAVWPENR